VIVRFWRHTIAKRQGGDNAGEVAFFLVIFRYQSRKDILLAFWYWTGFQLGWLNPNSSMGVSMLCTSHKVYDYFVQCIFK